MKKLLSLLIIFFMTLSLAASSQAKDPKEKKHRSKKTEKLVKSEAKNLEIRK